MALLLLNLVSNICDTIHRNQFLPKGWDLKKIAVMIPYVYHIEKSLPKVSQVVRRGAKPLYSDGQLAIASLLFAVRCSTCPLHYANCVS